MICVVAGVSTLIHLYSVAYMDSDRGYVRFFAYLNFFVFSMLLLVLAGNFVLLIVGWAFVGAASYFLISFWYRRTTATRAGIKAFVINVLGDVGLVLGTYFIFKHTHTLDFLGTFHQVHAAFGSGNGDLVAGCILLLVGAFAKSAQIPLHTWLPDAMEGPTPVSALIHAATMVTAGVYLIARMHPLFEAAPAAADVGAIIGALTLLIAGTIGLVQTDLKRVIAYSTMSQIGYMIMGVSAGAYAAGLFHLMTHAFFKALLFMAAGSVIGAMAGNQSLDRMSGFRKAMPFTFVCFVVGGLALSGIPPFSGFFSKDEILLQIGAAGGWHWALYVAGYVGALLTAVYTFRMIFRAFLGEPCAEALELEDGHLHHADVHTNPATGEIEDTDVGFPGPEHQIAERRPEMRIAMGTLVVLAVIGGIVQIPKVTNWLDALPGADLRRLGDRPQPVRRPARVRPPARGRGRPRRDRDRLLRLGPQAGDGGQVPGPAAADPHAVPEQVVLRRVDRPPRRPSGRLVRALRPADVRAGLRQRDARRRDDRPRQGRVGRGARGADRLPALLRRPADRRTDRPRPLLPAPVRVMAGAPAHSTTRSTTHPAGSGR